MDVKCYIQSSDWPEVIWTEGCIQKFEDYMRKELYTVAGVFIGVALVQVSSSSDRDPNPQPVPTQNFVKI